MSWKKYLDYDFENDINDSEREARDKAVEEGFLPVATSFYRIAEIEKTHGDRFGMFADLLESGKLFAADEPTQWMCLNCGHIHTGMDAPEICPVCHHPQGYFIRMEQAPYTD